MRKALVAIVAIAAAFMMSIGGAISAEPIFIGEIAALTGATSQQGLQERNGCILAMEEINAAGGLLGRPIKLVTYDFKGLPAEGVSVYRQLVQEGAKVIIGTNFSNVNLAIAPVAEQLKIPVVSNAIEPKVTIPAAGQINKYHFLTQPSAIEQGAVVARFALQELGMKTAACLVNNGNSFATSQAEAFRDYFNKNGGKVVEYIDYATGLLDFKALLTRIKAANPDCIYLGQYAQESGLQVKQAKELGIKATIVGNNTLSTPVFIETAGGAAIVEGSYYVVGVNMAEARQVAFNEKYTKRFGEPLFTTIVRCGSGNM
ncbi:MAG TPA: ABC transporter substrate-binding protein [Bacillota bacterium]|nr:ABC transporter substrate-binding protein [Bacillota bacterium]